MQRSGCGKDPGSLRKSSSTRIFCALSRPQVSSELTFECAIKAPVLGNRFLDSGAGQFNFFSITWAVSYTKWVEEKG